MNYRLNPYLSFDGNCDEAFALYSRVFGGQPQTMRYGQAPGESPIPAEYSSHVMHTQLALPGGQWLMGSDVVPGFSDEHKVGNNVTISLIPDTLEEAERILKALAVGGRVLCPLEQQFFGYMGISEDAYGVQWLVTYGTEMQ